MATNSKGRVKPGPPKDGRLTQNKGNKTKAMPVKKGK